MIQAAGIISWTIIIIVFVLTIVVILKLGHNLASKNQAKKSNSSEKKPCPNCAREIKTDEKFCPGCGTPIRVHTPPGSGTDVDNLGRITPTIVPAYGLQWKYVLPITAGILILGFLVYWAIFGFDFLSYLSIGGNVNRYPPYEVFRATGNVDWESQYNYAVADMQLGGPATQHYYREYAGDAQIENLLGVWDMGERVVNIYQFDRQKIDGIWEVVYSGTQEAAQGADFVLTTDIGALNYRELQVRYILADAQLGNVIEDYRQYTSDPAIAEAMSRWDAGVRVLNINQFERLIQGNAGWKLLDRNTEQLVQADQIMLSTDRSVGMDGCGTDDDRISYIIADIQLGDVEGYYRSFINDPVVAEALRLWDTGVRVTNIDAFERHIVGDKGWSVTDVSSEHLFSCAAIQVSSVGQPQSGEWGICNNPYFPVKSNGSWEYTENTSGRIVLQFVVHSSANDSGDNWWHVLTTRTTDQGDLTAYLKCDPEDGAIRYEDGRLLVPPTSAFLAENVFSDPVEGLSWRLSGPLTYQTPAGTFDNCFTPILLGTDAMMSTTYCYGIGQVSELWSENSVAELNNYYIP